MLLWHKSWSILSSTASGVDFYDISNTCLKAFIQVLTQPSPFTFSTDSYVWDAAEVPVRHVSIPSILPIHSHSKQHVSSCRYILQRDKFPHSHIAKRFYFFYRQLCMGCCSAGLDEQQKCLHSITINLDYDTCEKICLITIYNRKNLSTTLTINPI